MPENPYGLEVVLEDLVILEDRDRPVDAENRERKGLPESVEIPVILEDLEKMARKEIADMRFLKFLKEQFSNEILLYFFIKYIRNFLIQ